MSERSDGGPAYPVHDAFAFSPKTAVEAKRLGTGMSLRDAVALAILPAVYTEYWRNTAVGQGPQGPEWPSDIAANAFRVADAFIAARERS